MVACPAMARPPPREVPTGLSSIELAATMLLLTTVRVRVRTLLTGLEIPPPPAFPDTDPIGTWGGSGNGSHRPPTKFPVTATCVRLRLPQFEMPAPPALTWIPAYTQELTS